MKVEMILFILGGHAICTDPLRAQYDDAWVGGFPREGPKYLEHIQATIEECAKEPTSILVFSGGMTREEAGRRSEADSYYCIAEANGWFGHPELCDRTLKEEYARDSFENVLYSIAVARGHYNTYPTHLVCCGWKFKEQRFDLHRLALKWPKNGYRYFGISDPPDGRSLMAAIAGETAKLVSVRQDLYLQGREWQSQREMRNPYGRHHNYRDVAPELTKLFDFLERNSMTTSIPWAHGAQDA